MVGIFPQIKIHRDDLKKIKPKLTFAFFQCCQLARLTKFWSTRTKNYRLFFFKNFRPRQLGLFCQVKNRWDAQIPTYPKTSTKSRGFYILSGVNFFFKNYQPLNLFFLSQVKKRVGLLILSTTKSNIKSIGFYLKQLCQFGNPFLFCFDLSVCPS